MNFYKNIYNKIHSKIFYKLLFYFGLALLLFSITVGIIFANTFVKNTISLNKKNLETRAMRLSDTIANIWYGPLPPHMRNEMHNKHISRNNTTNIDNDNNRNNNNNNNENKKSENNFLDNVPSSRRRNMKLIDDIAMVEVWVVDAESREIFQGKNNNTTSTLYTTLPENAENMIQTALNGKLNTSESFSDILENRTLTVAAPVFSKENNKIVAAVLLHSPVENMNEALNNGIYTLIFSMLIALIFISIIAIYLSLSFTTPLTNMSNVAHELGLGNYEIKTNISQNDEIGELAKSIDDLSIKLYNSSKESEHFEKMRNNFITNISHELRTPITVIRGSIEAICDGIITEKEMVDEFHNQILSDTIHLQRLVNDLIDLTKLQNPDFSILKEEINITDIVNDSIRSMQQIANKKNITINFKNNSQYLFLGDYQRIRQMIIIILDNAIKFSYDNSNIDVSLNKENNIYKLNIINLGIGISEEDLNNIFNRFHKSQSQENSEGMGLGLAIAKHIALRHNINIKVTSIPNEKTTFSFDFPVI